MWLKQIPFAYVAGKKGNNGKLRRATQIYLLTLPGVLLQAELSKAFQAYLSLRVKLCETLRSFAQLCVTTI